MAEIFRGVGVSPGVGVGSILLHEPEALPVVPAPVPPERVEEEIERFRLAREQAAGELSDLRARTMEVLGEHYAGVLDAQLLILEDPTLVDETIRRVRVGRVSARWALKEVVKEFIGRFESVDDHYLRERGGDLDDVHRRLQRLLRARPVSGERPPDGPLILVAHSLGPSDAVSLSSERIVGLATDMGGRTSHTAILAQALSLPAVVGLHDMSVRVQSGDPVILDGDTGQVVWIPDEKQLEDARERRVAWLARDRQAVEASDLPARTLDGVDIKIRANIEFPGQVERARRNGAQGVGLYRSEFLFLTHAPELPTEEQHYRAYRQLAEKVAPHPAVIRTLDLGGEKYFHEVLDTEAPNPVLGLRGVRLWLRRPDIHRPQLRGLLRAAAHSEIHVMIPLVTVGEEIREARRLLHQEARKLKAEGIPCRESVPLGIMVEVPAAAATADLLAQEADFFSIGTNDLIQYALAADRANESVAYLAQPGHPAILRMIQFIVESAKKAGIPVALCGEMGADPSLTKLLVGLGLRELSVQPRAIPAVRAAIQEIDSVQAEQHVEEALRVPGGRKEKNRRVTVDPTPRS